MVLLSRLSPTTPWQWTRALLLARAVYQGILQSADIEFNAPSPDEVSDLCQAC
jgi:hypothetical protein